MRHRIAVESRNAQDEGAREHHGTGIGVRTARESGDAQDELAREGVHGLASPGGEQGLEAVLVERAQRGDATAIAALVELCRPLIVGRGRWYIYCFRRGQASANPWLDEEDIVQEIHAAFLELVREYDLARGVPFRAYVAAKLGWRVRNYLRAQHKGWRHQVSLSDEEGTPAGAGPHAAVALAGDCEALAAAELRASLAGALGALSPRQRAVVIGSYAEGRSTAELADRLGVSPQAVRGLRRRALAQLRQTLADGSCIVERRT